MSLRSFLDALAQSPAAQRSFFEAARHAMLRAMARHYSYLPHQMLEDAVMLAFEQLWKDGIGQFVSPHPVGSDGFHQDLVRYLALVIAPRRLLDLRRKAGREVPVGDLWQPNGDEVSDESLFDQLLPPAEDDVAGGAERRQLLQRLRRCVDHLSPKLREVIHGALADVRQADTAQSLGIPEGTVKSRMNEATKRLKQCMGIGAGRA
ncbi:RNA polymerase sigma factor [Pulveribacter sp.]|uniref:RNA polymerase sigma factor n=1 Tax=Pulveribacter sp. TaxID=2678893 RepID=UPI0028A89C35|nr:RNA polymerase sigma factor [Pulveribacter sp.]